MTSSQILYGQVNGRRRRHADRVLLLDTKHLLLSYRGECRGLDNHLQVSLLETLYIRCGTDVSFKLLAISAWGKGFDRQAYVRPLQERLGGVRTVLRDELGVDAIKPTGSETWSWVDDRLDLRRCLLRSSANPAKR